MFPEVEIEQAINKLIPDAQISLADKRKVCALLHEFTDVISTGDHDLVHTTTYTTPPEMLLPSDSLPIDYLLGSGKKFRTSWQHALPRTYIIVSDKRIELT